MPGFDVNRFVNISRNDIQEYLCGICKDVFRDPVYPPCCGNIFCKDCIESALEERPECPYDRKKVWVTQLQKPSRNFINLMSKLHMTCDFESRGCLEITTYGELNKHLDECEHNICGICDIKMGPKFDHNCIDKLKEKIALLETYETAYEELKLKNRFSSFRKRLRGFFQKS